MSLHRDALEALQREAPDVQQMLTEALIIEIRRLAAALVDALYMPIEQRVWRRLRELGEMYRQGGDASIVPLTQDDLAQLAGTTRSKQVHRELGTAGPRAMTKNSAPIAPSAQRTRPTGTSTAVARRPI